jgi:BMFP domain-containing protein YqiC
LRKFNNLNFFGQRVRTTVVHDSAAVHRLGEAARNRARHPDSMLAFWSPLRYQSRMNSESIEGLARKLADAVPDGLKTVRDDLEQNFRAVLKGGLSKLDLVTRDEFEVQEAVLERTRTKLEALEAKVAELEGDD